MLGDVATRFGRTHENLKNNNRKADSIKTYQKRVYTCYNADKHEYLIRNKERINEEIIDFNEEYKEESFLNNAVAC